MMGHNSYIFTGERKDCTGCGACAQVCIHNALVMEEDHEGFLYPKLNPKKCVECGLCERTCPVVNDKSNMKEKQSYYLSTSNDLQECIKSATTGLCSIVSRYILEEGGIVYGCMLDEKIWKARHIRIVSIDEIDIIRNSKYLQSDTADTFSLVRNDLKIGKTVLYIGTPCEVAGLKSFLRKDYDHLFIIDIICHGVFSPKLMTKEVSYWEKRYNCRIKNFRFRSKLKYPWNYGGIVNFDIVKDNNICKHKEHHASCSPTYRSFAYSGDGLYYNLRESCYKCHFRSEKRYGDLTVGDAWGISEDYPQYFTQKNRRYGLSLLLINNQKGHSLVDAIEKYIQLYPIEKETAFKNTTLLPTNREIPYKRQLLYDNLDSYDYGQLVSELLEVNYIKAAISFKITDVINKVRELVRK